MEGTGFSAFNHDFSGRVAHWRSELRDLEREGVTYGEFLFDEDKGGPGTYRITFLPSEIYQFVRGLVGWDQYVAGGFDAVADRALARDAERAAAERREYDENADGVCPADFLGADVEDLVCGGRLDRVQRVRAADPHLDALAQVGQIAASLPTAVKSLTERGDGRLSFEINSERDLQDVFFFALRTSFDDVRREEWTPSSAGGSKRVDLLVPEARVMIEIKFVRDARHARTVADELRVDFESYHSHPACGTLVAIVWDPKRRIGDPKALERDLSGSRIKGDKAFEVVVRVV
jgi:hypothetical protein